MEPPVTKLHEQIETVLPPDAAFDYIADFANAAEWDPGTERSERVDPGPVGVGARYRLDVRIGSRVAPMEYRITAFEPSRRVVLEGTGSGVSAVDEIRFAPAGHGTRIDYTADIRLGGLLRLVQPFLGRAFERVGRDAATGMRKSLDARAAGATPASAARR
jgi:carbon monoxide dehydrogenase subunit G